MKNQLLLVGALTFGATFSSVRADIDAAALQAALDQSLASAENAGATGGAVAIVRDGEVLWHGQRGVISRGSAARIEASTLFAYGSVGKMVTATLVLQAAERGELSLEAPINDYLARDGGASVPGGDAVTVRQLLNHTSGYPTYEYDPGVQAKLFDQDHAWTRAEVLASITAAPAPGSFVYSGNNYVLLGEILERATGRTYGQLYQSGIAGPLGLTRSFVDSGSAPREAFAQGVWKLPPELMEGTEIAAFDLTAGVPTSLYGEVFADSAVAGNAVDGALFLDALVGRANEFDGVTIPDGVLLTGSSLVDMLTPGASDSGYGLGINVDTDGVNFAFGHPGGWLGYSAEAFYFSQWDISVVTLANYQNGTDGPHPASFLLRDVVGAYAAGAAIPEPATAVGLAAVTALLVAASRRRHIRFQAALPWTAAR